MNPGANIQVQRGENMFCYVRGRVALCAILRALQLQPGDEVLLQAFTCLAVPSPIVGLGLTPVYVDVDPGTCNMNPALIEALITKRSRAIVVQHTFGIPAPLSAIMQVARKHGLVVIEDCCHALGSRYDGRDLGSFGDAAFYSYEWGKPIVIGVGGAAIIHSESILEAVRSQYESYLKPPVRDVVIVNLQYAAHSVLRRPVWFWAVRDAYRALSRSGVIISSFQEEEFEGKLNLGYDTRMSGVLHRRLSLKLREGSVRQSVARRAQLSRDYEACMRRLGSECFTPPAGSETVFLRFPLLARDKRKVLEEARENHIEIGDWFSSPVHPLTQEQWAKVAYKKGSCPFAETLSQRIVTLPLHEGIRPSDTVRTLDFVGRMVSAGYLERDAMTAERDNR